MAVFHMGECIRKTKAGLPLTDDEIRALVRGITAEDDTKLPDYQLSAWLMAVCLKGLTDRETAVLTLAMRDSGQVLRWDLPGAVVDKHSTGGVGDKTTLIIAPIVASCGVFMPKMSGRGLGHTGGTIDKLESIPGFRTALTRDEFLTQVREIGCAVAMQTADLAPADKKLYALRDVTETVDSIPLICASIMSKKLATGADHILLDVKIGSGAFMKTDADGAELARLMLSAAKSDGRDAAALLTDMDQPLGQCIGNALEVREALEVLGGSGDAGLTELCLTIAAELLRMAGKGTPAECRAMAERAVASGAALERFAKMVSAQGGTFDAAHPECLALSPCQRTVKAAESGWITAMHSEMIGRASVLLGAGRMRKEDAIDAGAGIRLAVHCGAAVQQGDPLLTMYAAKESQLDEAEAMLRGAIRISAEEPAHMPLIHAVYTTNQM